LSAANKGRERASNLPNARDWFHVWKLSVATIALLETICAATIAVIANG
jgi:hypothetical protein